MPKIVLAFVIVATTLSLPALPSSAALPCNLITDPSGDVTAAGGSIDDENVDILSADVGAGTSKVVAVMRLAKISASDPLGGPLGTRSYTLLFNYGAESTKRFLDLTGFQLSDSSGSLNEYRYGHVDAAGTPVVDGTATGTADLGTGVVTISASTTAWAAAKLPRIRKGAKLSNLTVLAQVHFVNGDSYGPEPANTRQLNPARPTDTAAGTKPYVVGSPGCVPAS